MVGSSCRRKYTVAIGESFQSEDKVYEEYHNEREIKHVPHLNRGARQQVLTNGVWIPH